MTELTLKRLPVKRDSIFLVYEGREAVKMVDGSYRKVSPVSFLEAIGILLGDLEYSVNVGFKIDSGYLMPYMQRVYGGTLKEREPKVKFTMKAWPLIDAYKTVELFGLLPEITTRDVRLLEKTENLINGYLEYGEKFLEPFEKKNSLLSRVLRKKTIESNIPEQLRDVSLEELKKALESEPPFLNGAGRKEKIDVVLMGTVREIKI
jgi:hypothetical protein